MTTVKSTKPLRPDKPRPDFPLYAHGSGQWAKKIKGRVFYFGGWSDPGVAEEYFNRVKSDLYAGRKPRPYDRDEDGIELATTCNHFLAAKKDLVESGELAPRTWDDYHRTCSRIVSVFGRHRRVSDLRPDDFSDLRKDIAKTFGPVALGNEINRVRSVFKYCYEALLIDKPVRYGPNFKRPTAKTLRLQKAKNGKKLFSPPQIHTLLRGASPHMKAMILLGINAGLGNNDIAQLREHHVCLESGWMDYPRPKTGVERRAKLWPETIDALRIVLAKRPIASDESDRDLFFITKYRKSWFKDSPDNPISKEFRKLADSTRIYRRGLTFYALRHSFETIGGDMRDQIAVNHVMGHVDDSMPGTYRQRIADDRLVAIADHVRAWLYEGATDD